MKNVCALENGLYKSPNRANLHLRIKTFMRISQAITAAALTLTLAGCAGPEQKLGRGINNLTEFARGGEIRRSMEQTALWDGTDAAYTTGFIRGFNRSVVRTAVGFVEVITFP